MVLLVEPSALHMPGRCSATDLHTSSSFPETESHYVAPAVLELHILLPPFPECCDYENVPPCQLAVSYQAKHGVTWPDYLAHEQW